MPDRVALRLAIALDWFDFSGRMFANLLQWITRQPARGYDRAFVTAVNVSRPVPRNPRAEKIILVCWALIAIKHVAVIWAVHHYAVPFHQLWINFPTFLLGLVATCAYYARD
jgi:hypothetical protein